MKKITGTDITTLRAKMALNHTQFAMLNGVHHTTACRWESTPLEVVKFDPMHQLILEHALKRFKKAGPDRESLARRIGQALIAGGTLAGLAVLLDDLTVQPQEPSHVAL